MSTTLSAPMAESASTIIEAMIPLEPLESSASKSHAVVDVQVRDTSDDDDTTLEGKEVEEVEVHHCTHQRGIPRIMRTIAKLTTSTCQCLKGRARSWKEPLAMGRWMLYSLLLLTLSTVMMGRATTQLEIKLLPNHTGDIISLGSSVVSAIARRHWQDPVWPGVLGMVIGGPLQAHLGNCFNQRSKGWVVISSSAQLLGLLTVGLLVRHGDEKYKVAAIVLGSAAGGAQIALARALMREVTTCVFTGPLIDLLASTQLLTFWRDEAALRRVYMFGAVLLGSVSSGVFVLYKAPMQLFWLSMGLRALFVVAVVFAPVEQALPTAEHQD